MSTAPNEPPAPDEVDAPQSPASLSAVSDPDSARQAEKTWRRDVLDPALAEQPERQDPFVSQQMQWPVKDLYTPGDLEEIGFD